MKKLFIPALIFLSGLNAKAYYHPEFGRATITLSTCTLGGYAYNDGASCTRNADASITVTFANAYTVIPYCHMQAESGGSAFWISPALEGFKVQSVLAATNIFLPMVFNYECTGY